MTLSSLGEGEAMDSSGQGPFRGGKEQKPN